MKSTFPLVLLVALASVAPIPVSAVGSAQAAEVGDEAPGVVGILPVPWAVADGESKIKVQVVVLTEGGRPISGADLEPGASAGEVSGWKEVGPGLYKFDFVPPASDKALQVPLTVQGKIGKTAVEATTTVRLARNPVPDLSGATTPDKIVLGQNTEATLSITGGPPKGDLLVRNTTSGSVENLTNMGKGKFTARFAVPKENFPQLGIIALANAANPVDEYGYVAIPLHGAVNYPVESAPNASVILKIGDDEYGPVKASADGKAAVPIIVPPGIDKATQITVVEGESTEKALDLRVPETQRVKAIPTAKSVPADSDIDLPIRLVVLTPEGKPDKSATVEGRATNGSLGKFTHAGKGIYQAMFTPADSDEAKTASISLGLQGNDKQVDTLEIQLSPRRATELLVTTDPPDITAATRSIDLMAVANGSNGRGVDGQTITLDVTGGSVSEEVSGSGEGTYAGKILRTAEVTQIGAVVTGAPSDNPPAHIVVLPARDRFNGDGASSMSVVVVAVDAFGSPVPGVEVDLTVEGGGATLPGKTKTNEQGFSRVELTAGKGDSLVTVSAQAGPARGAGAVLQGGKRKALKDLPVGISASKDVRELHRSWEAASVNLRLKLDPNAPPPVPKVELGDASAEVAVLDVTFFPAQVPPGGTVTVRTIPFDADGKAIPGKTLDVLTSAGDLGKTAEDGGIYETKLTVDEDGEGEAKVSVVAPSGVMKLVRIPIDPDAVVAGADDEDDGPAVAYAEGGDDKEDEPEEAKPPKEPKEPRQPSASGEHPWVRARLSGVGSVYRYSQTPTDEPGPLIPAPLTVGGAGSPPATPVGFEANGRAWVPDIPYVGGVVNFRSSWYSIASGAFDGDAPDWLYDVSIMATGRYPFDVNSDQFWVGGKAGFHYGDFMLFTGCLDPGCQVNFDPLGMPGLGLGAELGAELEDSDLYFVGGYTHALANFSVPYMNAIDANVGMKVYDPIDVDLGFSWVNRKVALEGTDSGTSRGEISDGQIVFKLGVGFEM